jgi:hypothetical protein
MLSLGRITKSDQLAFGGPGGDDDLQPARIILDWSHKRHHIGRCQALHTGGDAMKGLGVLSLRIEEWAADLAGSSQPFLASPGLLIQSCILDRNPRRRSQRQDELLVLGGERSAVDAVRQIQIAEDRVAAADRYAEESCHRWMAGREPR